jgi:histidine triad (HIT) family protein
VLIPRSHVASLDYLAEADEGLVGHLIRVGSELARKENVATPGYRLVANCGPDAGQSVDHLHFHLLGGRSMGWPPG